MTMVSEAPRAVVGGSGHASGFSEQNSSMGAVYDTKEDRCAISACIVPNEKQLLIEVTKFPH